MLSVLSVHDARREALQRSILDSQRHGRSYWRDANSACIEVGLRVEIATCDASMDPALVGLRGKVDGLGIDRVAVDLARLPGYVMVLPSVLRVITP
jgi:hypothetical protein